MGHVSNKETQGASSVTQRMWGDWFMLSEASTCVYSRSGFPRFACLASALRGAGRSPLFEKDICGIHREGALLPPPLPAGCDEPPGPLALSQCVWPGHGAPAPRLASSSSSSSPAGRKAGPSKAAAGGAQVAPSASANTNANGGSSGVAKRPWQQTWKKKSAAAPELVKAAPASPAAAARMKD